MNCPFCHKIDQEVRCVRCGTSLPKRDPRPVFIPRYDNDACRPLNKTVYAYWHRKNQIRLKPQRRSKK